MINLTPLFNALIALLASIVTFYLVPWLRGKCTTAQLANAAYWAKVFVSAAEQMFTGGGRGEEKLRWVQDELAKRGWKLDTSEVRALIEAQVRALVTEGAVMANVIGVQDTATVVAEWEHDAVAEVKMDG